jgi:hypothetical protein
MPFKQCLSRSHALLSRRSFTLTSLSSTRSDDYLHFSPGCTSASAVILPICILYANQLTERENEKHYVLLTSRYTFWYGSEAIFVNTSSVLSLSLMLRPTASQPVCLGIKHPSGAYDQIFITVGQLRVC